MAFEIDQVLRSINRSFNFASSESDDQRQILEDSISSSIEEATSLSNDNDELRRNLKESSSAQIHDNVRSVKDVKGLRCLDIDGNGSLYKFCIELRDDGKKPSEIALELFNQQKVARPVLKNNKVNLVPLSPITIGCFLKKEM